MGAVPSREYWSSRAMRVGLPRCLLVKNPPASAGDTGSIPGSGRSPGGGSDNPLQCSCLESPVAEEPGGLQSTGSQSQTQLSTHSVDTLDVLD